MKVKEVKEKESKVKEIKKETEEQPEEETIEDLVEGGFSKKETDEFKEEEFADGEEPKEKPVLNASSVLLEEFVADASVVSDFKSGETEKDFYKTSAGSGDFYGGKSPSEIYSGTSDIYNSSGNGSYLSNGENQNTNGNFYNLTNSEQEKVGEIRGARGSRLETEGVRGAGVSKKDKRTDDKYAVRSY